MNSKQNYLLALGSAILMWLAWPPIPYTAPLLLVALVPLLIAIQNITKNSGIVKKGKHIFLTAGLTFVVWNVLSIYWVYNAISAYNGPLTALPVSLIPFCLGPFLLSSAIWLYYQFRKYTSKNWAYVGLISFYIAFEYLQQTWDLSFPWMTLGNSLANTHQIAQWYEYTGIYGGSLWILVSNIIAFEAYNKLKTKDGYLKFRTVIVWAIVVIIPITYSLITYSKYVIKGTPSNVVVVQPNIDPYKKFEYLTAQDQINILTHLTDSIAEKSTEFIIWPETAIPNYADEDKIESNLDFKNLQNFMSKYKNGSLITGIETVKTYQTKKTLSAKYSSQSNTYWDNFNTAMQIENYGSAQFYHKSKLVPGVEKMPFPKLFSSLDFIFAELGGTVGGWGWQEEPGVFYSRIGIGAAPVICYESLWGDWIGKSVKNGAQFISIITNDAWWGNTAGKDQHALYAKLRAIETRRDIARSANTGISCFINQKGDITHQTEWWTRTALKADIALNDELTFYVKSGDVIAKLLSCLAVVFLILIPIKKWKKKTV